MTNLGVYAWLLILMCFERVHVTFGYISLSIFQCLFHLQDVLYRMFLCTYLLFFDCTSYESHVKRAETLVVPHTLCSRCLQLKLGSLPFKPGSLQLKPGCLQLHLGCL